VRNIALAVCPIVALVLSSQSAKSIGEPEYFLIKFTYNFRAHPLVGSGGSAGGGTEAAWLKTGATRVLRNVVMIHIVCCRINYMPPTKYCPIKDSLRRFTILVPSGSASGMSSNVTKDRSSPLAIPFMDRAMISHPFKPNSFLVALSIIFLDVDLV
jgi:hypothetical protein